MSFTRPHFAEVRGTGVLEISDSAAPPRTQPHAVEGREKKSLPPNVDHRGGPKHN